MHDDVDYPMGVPTFERPTLLSSCALAATAAEARFRIPYPNSVPRQSRVIALDEGAVRVVLDVVDGPWLAARFLTLAAKQPDVSPNDVLLHDLDGGEKLYSAEVEDADLVVLVATTSAGARDAAIIGRIARARSIMTAGIVIPAHAHLADSVVAAMRPSAAVLVIATGDDYLAAMLSAMRA